MRPHVGSPAIFASLCALVATFAGCTFSPSFPDGKILCSFEASCPVGLHCADDGRCYRVAPSGSGGAVGGAGMGGRGGSGGLSTPGSGGSGRGGAGGSVGIDAMTPVDGASPAEVGVPTPDAAVDRPLEVAPPVDANPPPPDVQPPMEVSQPVDWPICLSVPMTPGLATSLLVHLRLDEEGGNPVATDTSPNKVEAMVSGLPDAAKRISGRLGRGLALTGGANGGYVRVNSTNVLNQAYDGFGFSAWLKFAPAKPGDGVIASRRAEGPYGYLYRISVNGGKLRTQIHTANGFKVDFESNQALPTDGRWMHVLVNYAINPGYVAMFVNGNPFGSVNSRLQLGPENTPLVFGGAESIVRPPMGTIPPPVTIIDRLPGAFDEVAFYKRTLTEPEIKALACGVSPVP
ncbi:MAG TPA: LamG domain-containing protein [Polyangia bacterium]